MNENPNIALRDVNKSDIDFLFNLRNQDYVYKQCRNPNKVEYSEHIKWLKPIMNNERPIFLHIILYNGEKAGQIRLDFLENNSAEISISILKPYHRKGIASYAIKEGIKILEKENINKIFAEIRKENLASINLFESLRFVEFENNGGLKKFRYSIGNINL